MTKIKRVVKQKSSLDKNKIAKKILAKESITRDEANYLIKTVLEITLASFCEKSKISYHHLKDALLMFRPFSQSLQNQIIIYCRENLR